MSPSRLIYTRISIYRLFSRTVPTFKTASRDVQTRENEHESGCIQPYQRLNRFFHDFYAAEVSVHSKRSSKETNDIGQSVQTLVETIIYKALNCNPIFHIHKANIKKNVLCVGSFYEGTKVGDVTEFDFTIQFPHFSYKDIKVIKKIKKETLSSGINFSTNNPVFRQLQYTGCPAVKSLLLNNNLIFSANKEFYLDAFGLHEFLLNRVTYILHKLKYVSIGTESGELKITDSIAYQNGPAITVSMEWQSINSRNIEITVDLVPAVETLSQSVKGYLKKTNYLQKNSDKITHCYWIPRPTNECFQVSFAPFEVELMKTLHQENLNWVISFKILKFILSYGKVDTKLHIFSSYVLKTLLWHELYKDGTVTTIPSESVAHCFMRLWHLVMDISQKQVLSERVGVPSLWIKGHMVVYKDHKHPEDVKIATRIYDKMKKVDTLLTEIMEDESYSYEHYANSLKETLPIK